MLPENMKVGMKVAVRLNFGYRINHVYSTQDLKDKFIMKPYYIVRILERPDEFRDAPDSRLYCVVNEDIERLDEGQSKEGRYGFCDMMEPYDLAMEKQNNDMKARK
jgi:hypothetical protein